MSVMGQGYVVIEATDTAKWHEFLTGVVGAMDAGTGAEGARLYRIDERAFRFAVKPGATDRLAASGFLVVPGSLDALAGKLAAAGRPVEEASAEHAAARGATRLVRTSDSDGHPLEFYEGAGNADTPFVSPLGIPRFVTGEQELGHSVFGVSDFPAALAFYRDVIGLGASDLPSFQLFGPEGPKTHAAFLYGDGGRHHCVAIMEMPPTPNGCVHLMVELENLEEVGKAYDRAIQGGWPISATLGKHENDNVTSFYVKTPGGFDMEIGFDGVIVDRATWKTTECNNISIWGHEWAWQKAMKEAQATAAE